MNSAQPQTLASARNVLAGFAVRMALVCVMVLFLQASLVTAQQISPQAQAAAQGRSARSRIVDVVDETDRTVLEGNTHPLALPEFDKGAANSGLQLKRMLMVLKRSAEQEAALGKLLEEQQDRSSANYHRWLTPEEFGTQFGPSDADIQAITGWLGSHGFQDAKVGRGRTVIEFSGTAAQVQDAFHTEIHRFAVNDEERWANVSDPEIPAALAPAVHGLVSLHNFPKKPMSHLADVLSESRVMSEVSPLFTLGGRFAVGPGDFAKIYNVQGLWNMAPPIDGTGQSIAIVGESNINIQDVKDFRTFFGLPPNDPEIIVNGPDPGIIKSGLESEALLDVQWSGAVARNAKIKFVVAESTLTSAGVDLAALYIIDNNIAAILSESFGACEAVLGSNGNAFFNALWQQAAAQGITVMVSSGDGGSAGCDNFNTATSARNGIAVSGLASTPFNIAVGGTDFDDAGRQTPDFWDTTNDPVTRMSAKSYIPETTWNNSCAGRPSGCATPDNIVAASGGPSSQYQKPAWQMGAGVPSDGKRDLPDVSLFASTGALSRSSYVFCQADRLRPGDPPSCGVNGSFSLSLAGGTSISAPAFAGMMALVNQKLATPQNPEPRQGNANFVLYKLAAQAGNSCDSSNPATISNPSCVFYDVTSGNISVPCVAGSPNCGSAGVLVDSSNTPAWTAHPGYDLATGLGTVNAFNLVNKWSSVPPFTTSTTTLTSVSPTTITHGQPISFTITVSGNGGTPTGRVALVGGPSGGSLGIDGAVLSNGTVTFPTNLLPGSNPAGAPYNVRAHYDGDGTFGASDSTTMSVTVSPEDSQTQLDFVTFDPITGPTHNATAAVYGSPYILRVNVVSKTSPTACRPNPIGESGCPTGTVLLTDNGIALDGGTFGLNSRGFLEDQPIQLPAGPHVLAGAYGGDNSFNGSTSAAVTVSISKAATTSTVVANPTTVGAGANVTLTTTINTQSNAVANAQQEPNGTVQFSDNGSNLGNPVTVTGGKDSRGLAQGIATLNISFAAAGAHSITARYTGDNNYSGSDAAPTQITVLAFILNSDPPINGLTAGASAMYTISAAPQNGFSGSINLTCLVQPPAGVVPPTAPTCTFSNASITPGGNPSTSILTVATTSRAIFPRLTPGQRWPSGPALPFVAFGELAALVAAWMYFAGSKRQRSLAGATLAALVMLFILTVAGCGGGSSSPPAPHGTTAGQYTITVTGTSGSLTHSIPVTLNVN